MGGPDAPRAYGEGKRRRKILPIIVPFTCVFTFATFVFTFDEFIP